MSDEQPSNNTNPIIWLDCEMTGLNVNDPNPDVADDELIEIGVFVTDAWLRPVDAGINIVIKPSPESLDRMNDFVRKMHTSSGLLKNIEAEGVSLTEAEDAVMAYITAHVPTARTAPIGGNTVGMDRRFLAKYMPRVENYAHYRTIDSSTVKEVMSRWFDYVVPNLPVKNGNHRALADAIESARELDYYYSILREQVNAIHPDDLRRISAETVDKWATYLK